MRSSGMMAEGTPITAMLEGHPGAHMLCLCQSGCVLWISGGPTGKECIRFQPHDGNTILRYAYGSENEIARRHGVVHKDFQCRKRTGLLGIDGLNAGRIPSSAMERCPSTTVGRVSTGVESVNFQDHSTPCSSCVSTLRTEACPSGLSRSEIGVAYSRAGTGVPSQRIATALSPITSIARFITVSRSVSSTTRPCCGILFSVWRRRNHCAIESSLPTAPPGPPG